MAKSYRFCSICGSTLKKKGPRLACTVCPFVNYQNPRPTATAIVIRDGKILMTKRARAPFKGWWDLPGGFIERGESPEKATIRELKEETGLRISLEKILGIYPGTYPSDFDPFSVLSIIYIARTSKGDAGAFDDVAESKWFPIEKLPKKIAFDSNERAVKDFLKPYGIKRY